MKKLVLVALSILVIAITLYTSLAVFVASRAGSDTAKSADAIMVLGARSYINGKYNPCLLARIDHASALYKAKKASTILVTGGDDKEDGVNEAETMKKMLVEKGFAERNILLEKKATSTYENFVLSKPIVRKANLHSVLIVTGPFHVARVELIAKKAGYTFSVSPAMESPCGKGNMYLSKYFLKEPIAIMVYKLQGKL